MKSDYHHELVQAYWNSTYRLVDQQIDIFIGKKNNKLIELLKSKRCNSWAILTAWNPNSDPQIPAINMKLNLKLEKELIEKSFDYHPVIGIPEDELLWTAEESFFILDITIKEACILGNKFKQNAFVFGAIDCLPSIIWLNEL